MHELTVTENLLQLALHYANDAPITDLYIVVGQLSSIVDDSVQFYWDIISKGTTAEHSRLHFQRVPAEMQCSECQHQYKLNESHSFCPICGSKYVRLIAGDQFYLDSIEVKLPEEIST